MKHMRLKRVAHVTCTMNFPFVQHQVLELSWTFMDNIFSRLKRIEGSLSFCSITALSRSPMQQIKTIVNWES